MKGMSGIQPTFGFVCKEAVDLCNSAVEGTDLDTVVCSIENEVLAHNGQADETEVRAVRMAEKSAKLLLKAAISGPSSAQKNLAYWLDRH